jgi:hypothetical protein
MPVPEVSDPAPFVQFLKAVAEAGNESAKRHVFQILAATGFGDTKSCD